MAMTLVQFWQQERDTHDTMQSAVQNDLAVAQLALVTAKASLDAGVGALNALGAEIAANRAKLAVTSVPSEVTALNRTIRDQLIRLRTLQGRIMDLQDDVATAQGEANAAAAADKRAARRLAECDAGLTAARDAGKQRQFLTSQLGLPPLATMPADATAALASAAATDAKTVIDRNFPPSLQALAAARHTTRADRVTHLRRSVTEAEDALATTLATTAGLAGTAAQKATDLTHAEQAARAFVTAARRFDGAMACLTALQRLATAAQAADVLTAQEQLDVAESAARTAAQANALPLDADRRAVDLAQQALDAEIITQIGVSGAALSADPAIKTKRDGVIATAATLTNAQQAFVASGERTVLDQWEIVVPDAAWQRLIDYLDARATLTALGAASPATLATAVADAEHAYAQALADAAKAQRQADALADVVVQRSERVETASAALPGRLLSAVRGDSF